jgi:UDP-N-acetylmuramyl pentapeptide synthase
LVGELGIDQLVAISNQDYLDGLTESQTQTHYFGSVVAANTLQSAFEAGDVVLVKASRAEHLEELANAFIEARQVYGEEGSTK